MSESDCNSVRKESQHNAPSGAVGPQTDGRDASGRFAPGNTAALVTGEDSVAFWNAQEAAQREIRDAVITDAGQSVGDAPKALVIAADGLAQAVLLRDSAFRRLVIAGGPLTSKDRARRVFSVWLSATDRVDRYLRHVGLTRVPRTLHDDDNIEAALAKEPAAE